MLSIAPLASPDYYLGSAASSGEAFQYFAGVDGASQHADPLLRQGRWLGRLSAEIGLIGSTVTASDAVRASDFESIYYGLHPTTGGPLRSDGKSKKAQMRDAKVRADCKKDRWEALMQLNQIRKEIKQAKAQETGSASPVATLELRHTQCKKAFAIADKAYRQAQQKSLRPGSDLVFSAPKSVSMQWAALAATGDTEGAKAIESAHDQAVRETFEHMQSEFVMTRKRVRGGDGGGAGAGHRLFEVVQGVIACQWRHFDARPVESVGALNSEGETSLMAGVPDPQLHDHINLFAPVRGADGEIYAAYTDYIRQNIKALGAMYRARLAQNLLEAGYRTERDAQSQGVFFALNGIGREQAKALSARTADIEALQEAGVSARDSKLVSRKAKNALSGVEVLQAWKQVFALLQVDPQVVKTATLADTIARDAVTRQIPDAALPSFARRMGRERVARMRTDAQILQTLLEKDAYFSLADIRQLLWEDAQFVGMVNSGLHSDSDSHPGLKSPMNLDAYVEERLRCVLRSPDLLKVMDLDAPAQAGFQTGLNRFGEPVFTTHSLRAREICLFGETVPALLKVKSVGGSESGGSLSTPSWVLEKALAQDVIQALEARLSADNLSKGGKAFVLRDFQVGAVLQATCGQSQLCVQIAGAGMGKTTSALFTKEIFVSQGLRVLGVAPSNKAASGLGRELGIDATSMDRLLLDLKAGRQTLDEKTVVFVDEAGMAGFDVMEKLMGWAVQSGCKLILTGDPEQLPAVARGNVLRKLTEMDALVSTPDALLYLGRNLSDWNKISRQKHDWAKQASAFFSQGMVSQGLAEYEKRDCIHGAMTSSHLNEDLAQAYLLDPAAPSQKLILATTNAQVKALNAAVRERLKAMGKLHGSWKLPDSTLELCLGDRIVFKERIDGGDRVKDPDQSKDRKHASDGKGKAGIAKNEFASVLSISRLSDGSLDIQCQLDTPKADGKPQIVRLNSKVLGDVDHAFATTVHRSQGMTVDSVFAVAGSFLSKELFYVMATRHRERLQFHMLESDRAMVMHKATRSLDKWHGMDLQVVDPKLIRAEGNATAWAGAGGGLAIVDRLRASRVKFLELMQKEKGRLLDWIRRQASLMPQTVQVAQLNSGRDSKSLKLLGQLAIQRAAFGGNPKQQDLGPVR